MHMTSVEIAAAFGLQVRGKDTLVQFARSLASAEAGALVFLSRENPETLAALNAMANITCITTPAIADKLGCAVIEHANPRLAFALIVGRFFVSEPPAGISEYSAVAADVQIGDDVEIGPGCVIDTGVCIGAGTRIHAQVVIAANSVIGAHCVIKSNTTIGESGFGFAKDEAGTPVHFPHLGSVEIGDYVEIGANCTVVRAALDKTVVEDYVKTDDHVHIAHNCKIGTRTQIAAGAIISGSVSVAADVWIGPNATISDYIQIGEGARIAIGAVVLRDVEPRATMIGNPAKSVSRQKSE
jgi:UDP-3-O-[3-hydroxymyristoyl] glucosamine N-acyltransferase